MRYTFEVPATSANLGSGFDAIGVALELRLRASMIPNPDGFRVRFEGTPQAPTHDGFERDIVRGMRALVDALPSVELRVENIIPLGRGLGSSAAAIVLGLLAADAAYERNTSLETFVWLAARLEGHPDNTTPALTGGIVISALEGVECFEPLTYLRIAPPANVIAVIAIPDFSLATEYSRGVLPKVYTKADCIFNVQRAALLAASFASGDLTRLRVGMQDRMHQPYRGPLVPGLEEALALQKPGLLGVALSGAGPSVLAFAEENAVPAIKGALYDIFDRHDIISQVIALEFASNGASCRRSLPAELHKERQGSLN